MSSKPPAPISPCLIPQTFLDISGMVDHCTEVPFIGGRGTATVLLPGSVEAMIELADTLPVYPVVSVMSQGGRGLRNGETGSSVKYMGNVTVMVVDVVSRSI